jgi:uncharacterized protein YciI
MKLADARGRYDCEMRAISILFCLAALAPAQSSPPGMRCPQRTLILSELGENAPNAARFQAEHFAYMRELMKSGKVITAGPMTDNHTTVIVLATKEWAEAEEILKKEPFHREGVLKMVKHMVWNACELEP